MDFDYVERQRGVTVAGNIVLVRYGRSTRMADIVRNVCRAVV